MWKHSILCSTDKDIEDVECCGADIVKQSLDENQKELENSSYN